MPDAAQPIVHSFIFATREGLIGKRTASGYFIDTRVSFVALPSRNALWRFVRITNPANEKTVCAQVLDVGPWNVDDDLYVFGGNRPQAETGVDSYGRKTNLAGIDLGEFAWSRLGMVDNAKVHWEFID